MMHHRQHSAYLVLTDGRVFQGLAIGSRGHRVGEVCFNTSITGYQEILSDPSYKDQLITFTTPHIGNVGVNAVDMESERVCASGVIVRQMTRTCSNYRADQGLNDWLLAQGVVGIADVDTRALTRHLRERGAVNGVIVSDGSDVAAMMALAQRWSGLVGRDLVGEVSCTAPSNWSQGSYDLDAAEFALSDATTPIAVLDFGCKQNILRMLTDRGLQVHRLPASSSAAQILACKPAGIFLSNGPGDPAAVGYAVATIRQLLRHDIPIFGICMGHQLLSQALGLATFKLKFGHRGGNHPVENIVDGKVEISSQNHGFSVRDDALPEVVEVTHRSLFDHTIEGLQLRNRPVFSVQYHPEASPGPHDGAYLFDRFAQAVYTYAAVD
ncbi:MAG: glutamine-hydrolyzing carbamoyl-phosphate synthase small subunit [Mariprofundales bacterium]|nr:glutamine-hydrolyzing carbamoyl-phosphate synthase small subunit [Mariprofundales bacterium]